MLLHDAVLALALPEHCDHSAVSSKVSAVAGCRGKADCYHLC